MTDTETTNDTEKTSRSAIKGELVNQQAQSAELVPVGQNAAIEAAADAALTMPGVPGRDEFLALAMQARMLSLSGAAPAMVRDNPSIAFHVAMVGRDLGISPSAAIELIDVIDTKKGPRLSLSPQLLNGQIRRLGLGSIRPAVQERDRCVAVAFGPDGTELGTTEFTWQDAQDAELVMRDCQPGQHTAKCRNYQTHPRDRCNQGYVTYPKRMMWWRAAGFCADDYFPEAGLGLYSPEELGAVVDDEGRPIDPATVGLPEGYPEPGSNGRSAADPSDETAAPADLWALQERIYALPEALRDQLRTAWKAGESRVKGHSPALLPMRLLRVAQAMVNGFEASAKSAGVDLADQLTDVRRQVAERIIAATVWAPLEPQDSPEPAAGPDTADTPTETQSDAQGTGSAKDKPPPHVDDDGVDWSETMRNVAAKVREVGADVPDEVISNIVMTVKALHHAHLNRHLEEAKIPTDGPIDLRRMHLALLRMRAWKAERDGKPAPGEPCEHGHADGVCPEVGCSHWPVPF
jgi:hypothetical protein